MSEEIEDLRNAIRKHRDQKNDDRCWMDDEELYAVLPEKTPTNTALTPKPVFLESCRRFCEHFWNARQKPEEKKTIVPVFDQTDLAMALADALISSGLVESGTLQDVVEILEREIREREGQGNIFFPSKWKE